MEDWTLACCSSKILNTFYTLAVVKEGFIEEFIVIPMKF